VSAWIFRRSEDELAAEAAAVPGLAPLAGLRVAVKDNIDVAGMPTTCACPAFSYVATTDAVCVARLRAAGAVIVGKTNMDQFATGLVGTRSPYGAVRDVRRPEFVSGGSSSGSAATVARGEVDVALGTDTAGSGRVPAAFQGIVGAKPSIGLVPTEGVVPACASFDCVSVFARTVDLARRVVAVISAAAGVGLAGPTTAGRLAIFGPAALSALSPAYVEAWRGVLSALRADQVELVEIDPAPFLEAGRLLYEGAFVRERYAAVGEFIAAHEDQCEPTVASIILGGRGIGEDSYAADLQRLAQLRAQAAAELAGCDGLLLPTAPFQPTLAEVDADPLGVNRQLGTFTTFCNLLGLCGYAVPGGEADGGQFGVTVLAAGGSDALTAAWAARIERVIAEAIPLLVVGAHMRGMPLTAELTARGGRFVRCAQTAACYKLYALTTTPPKPGLVRAHHGGSIAGEVWALPPSGLASLLQALQQPMALGRVTLDDGQELVGFTCETLALRDAREVTEFGGWRAYLSAAPN
jgi:allophanate hydrolase